ncbi:MAG: hypothetical protein ABJF10_03400 [Chthoniobacter sp.]|uniref:hypothetical protein n=1 Tax=Chthoniobacter sp. TaxID=2510640 RepID=UPI0032A15918
MYRVRLNGEEIGTTALEKGDPPMGVVFGKLSLRTPESPYHFFLNYCHAHGIKVNNAEAEHELIDTQVIPELRVYRADGVEISGQGCCISGFKDDGGYEITILGVPYPFYAEEFPHHCKAYEEQFKT